MIEFEIGQIYSRQGDIHRRFRGQEQGGISTPKDHALIFLFTGGTGKTYGYEDKWLPDGKFWYFGEGRQGDMQMKGGNRAIAEHARTGESLHLFEYVKIGHVRYKGEFHCEGFHYQEALDVDGNSRQAIVFELRQI